MRKGFAFISGAFVVWAVSSAAAFAFEQTILAPAPAVTAAPVVEPAPKLDGETENLNPQKKSGGMKIPGLGMLSLPKLNFGLDLMYGSVENDETGLGFSGDSTTDNDLTILGKVKRRF